MPKAAEPSAGECERAAAERQRRASHADDDRRDHDDHRDDPERRPQERRHRGGQDHEETERIRVEQRPALERPPADREATPADEPDERRKHEAQGGVQRDSSRDLGHGGRCYPAGSELWSATRPGASATGTSSSRRM